MCKKEDVQANTQISKIGQTKGISTDICDGGQCAGF